MEVVFSCPNCKQQLEAETTMAGTAITCPACAAPMTIPEADPANLRTHSPSAASAGAKEEKHFAVPVHDTPSEILIKKPNPPLEAARDGTKSVRIKCIKRTECVEVGKDHFDEVVSDFLSKVGEANIINISTISYTHVDMGSRQILTDYGVMVVYKG